MNIIQSIVRCLDMMDATTNHFTIKLRDSKRIWESRIKGKVNEHHAEQEKIGSDVEIFDLPEF